MRVEIVKPADVTSIYLEHLKTYPNKKCAPTIDGSKATFDLDLTNIYQCMVTKVVNKGTVSVHILMIVLILIRTIIFTEICSDEKLATSTIGLEPFDKNQTARKVISPFFFTSLALLRDAR